MRKITGWTEEEDLVFKEHYGKISCEEIIKRGLLPKRTVSALHNRANRLKLKNGNRKITNSFDEHFWTVPNHINAYWAGEIAADGCLQNPRENLFILSLEISTLDLEHLKEFKEAIKFSGSISFSTKTCTLSPYNNITKTCYFRVSRAKIWEPHLRNVWGIVPRKTYNIAPPAIDDNVLKLCYIVGYLDGDGTITADYTKKMFPIIRFTSCSRKILEWLKTVFDELFPNKANGEKSLSSPRTFTDKGACHYYTLSGFRAMKIMDILSRLPVPKLDRKWKNPRILEIMERYKQKYPVEWATALPIEREIEEYILKNASHSSPTTSISLPPIPSIPS